MPTQIQTQTPNPNAVPTKPKLVDRLQPIGGKEFEAAKAAETKSKPKTNQVLAAKAAETPASPVVKDPDFVLKQCKAKLKQLSMAVDPDTKDTLAVIPERVLEQLRLEFLVGTAHKFGGGMLPFNGTGDELSQIRVWAGPDDHDADVARLSREELRKHFRLLASDGSGPLSLCLLDGGGKPEKDADGNDRPVAPPKPDLLNNAESVLNSLVARKDVNHNAGTSCYVRKGGRIIEKVERNSEGEIVARWYEIHSFDPMEPFLNDNLGPCNLGVQMMFDDNDPRLPRPDRFGVKSRQAKCPPLNLYRGLSTNDLVGDPNSDNAKRWFEMLTTIANQHPLDLAVLFLFLRNKLMRPCDKIGGAPVMVSSQGSGKNSLLAPVMDALKPHAFEAQGTAQFTGSFNIHVTGKLLIHVNEAGASHTINQNPVWKAFITETVMNATAKFKDTKTGIANFADVIVSSNEEAPVPADGTGGGDRRFYQLLLPSRDDQPKAVTEFRSRIMELRGKTEALGWGRDANPEWRQYCADVVALLTSPEMHPEMAAHMKADDRPYDLELANVKGYLPDFWRNIQRRDGMTPGSELLYGENAHYEKGGVQQFMATLLVGTPLVIRHKESATGATDTDAEYHFRPAKWRPDGKWSDEPARSFSIRDGFDGTVADETKHIATNLRDAIYARYVGGRRGSKSQAENVFFRTLAGIMGHDKSVSKSGDWPTLETMFYHITIGAGGMPSVYDELVQTWREGMRERKDIRIADFGEMRKLIGGA